MKEINHLVEQAKAGDVKSYWELVELYYEEIFRFCRKKLFFKNQKAEDTTHDTFMKMMDSVKNLEESAKFKSYMYRVAYTNCIDRLKYCNRFIDPLEGDFDFIDIIQSHTPNPEEVSINACENEWHQKIVKTLESLSDEHKEIVRLVHFENRTYQDVAEILNIPIGTVRSRLNRALGRLRLILKEGD